MGKKNKQEKQLKAVKKRLELEQKAPKGRKPYAVALAISGLASLLVAGSEILVNPGVSMRANVCLMLGVASLFFAHKIYGNEVSRIQKIEALERERNDLLNNRE